MPTRKVLKGAICGFLGTYLSRYSDYDGYWLFGFLMNDHDTLEIDLVGEPGPGDSPLMLARRLAKTKFADQLRKHGLLLSTVREAQLFIERQPGVVDHIAGGYGRRGYNVSFRVLAVADYGRLFTRESVVFVARHDAGVERRSARATRSAPS